MPGSSQLHLRPREGSRTTMGTGRPCCATTAHARGATPLTGTPSVANHATSAIFRVRKTCTSRSVHHLRSERLWTKLNAVNSTIQYSTVRRRTGCGGRQSSLATHGSTCRGCTTSCSSTCGRWRMWTGSLGTPVLMAAGSARDWETGWSVCRRRAPMNSPLPKGQHRCSPRRSLTASHHAPCWFPQPPAAPMAFVRSNRPTRRYANTYRGRCATCRMTKVSRPARRRTSRSPTCLRPCTPHTLPIYL
mmetsp:Transcript_18805/g.48283  ORF Transcript_18805/g.48283 Transcript_18805/m.48283 type:complete len:247 (-) Transcript_18805:736-1476(-)